MYYIGYIIIGIVAGVIADKFTKEDGFGLFDNLLVGIVGGVLGGWAFSLLGIDESSAVGSLITSIIGAGLPLWGLSMIKNPLIG